MKLRSLALIVAVPFAVACARDNQVTYPTSVEDHIFNEAVKIQEGVRVPIHRFKFNRARALSAFKECCSHDKMSGANQPEKQETAACYEDARYVRNLNAQAYGVEGCERWLCGYDGPEGHERRVDVFKDRDCVFLDYPSVTAIHLDQPMPGQTAPDVVKLLNEREDARKIEEIR